MADLTTDFSSSACLQLSVFHEVVATLSQGSDAVRRLLLQDCIGVLECKVCVGQFRTVADFILHKAVDCKERFLKKPKGHRDSSFNNCFSEGAAAGVRRDRRSCTAVASATTTVVPAHQSPPPLCTIQDVHSRSTELGGMDTHVAYSSASVQRRNRLSGCKYAFGSSSTELLARRADVNGANDDCHGSNSSGGCSHSSLAGGTEMSTSVSLQRVSSAASAALSKEYASVMLLSSAPSSPALPSEDRESPVEADGEGDGSRGAVTPMEDQAGVPADAIGSGGGLDEEQGVTQRSRVRLMRVGKSEPSFDSMMDIRTRTCLVCHSKHGRVSVLRRHVARHIGQRRFMCKLCPFLGYEKSDCRRHLRRRHFKSDEVVLSSTLHEYIVDLVGT